MSNSVNKESDNDILNQRYSIFFPLVLAFLFASVKLIPYYFEANNDYTPGLLFGLDTICDCFSSAILPFLALAFIQQWILGIDIGLDPNQRIFLILAFIIHFTFYILYLWSPESLPLMYLMPSFSVTTFLALWKALKRYIKEGLIPHYGHTPSGNP